MQSLRRDVLFALRSLARSPMFTAVAVLSLALGIGANTAIFSLIDQVLLRSLPVQDPASLVMVITLGPHMGSNSGRNTLSYPMYKDYREKNKVFSGMLCSRTGSVSVSYDGPGEITEAETVSGNYFQVLGLAPAAGRLFNMGDETAPGANPVVVLNHAYWQSRFHGDQGIVGKTIRINSYPMTVVGVAGPGYDGLVLGFRTKLFVPVTMKKQLTPAWDDLENRRSRWLQVYARLKPGVSSRQAEAFIRTLHRQIINEEVKDAWFSRVHEFARKSFLTSYAAVIPGGQGFSTMRRVLEVPLKVLMALVGIVLLIACANVSNLMVARAAGRQKELAVRLALGAGRWRIVRQLFVESLILAFTGGALGLAVSYWSMRGMLLLAPTEQVRMSLSAAPDLRALAFALGVSLLAAVLFGLLPALHISSTALASTMKEQAGSIAGGHGFRTRQVLVAAQVMLSLVLVAGSALFVRSLQNLRKVDPGFRLTNLLQLTIDPMLTGYSKERAREFYRQVQQRLESLPGVEGAALARVGVLAGDSWDSTITVEGYDAKENENMNPHFNAVSPRYFKTLGITMKAGREFDDRDHLQSPKAVVVNETFAKRYFPGRSPLGYKIAYGRGPQVKPNMEIVGVVADSRYSNMRDEPTRQVFVCHPQFELTTGMLVYVRTSQASERMFNTVRNEVRGMDPGIPIYNLLTMEDQLDRSLSVERLVAFLSTAYGALAAALAVLGLYGVTAYGVARPVARDRDSHGARRGSRLGGAHGAARGAAAGRHRHPGGAARGVVVDETGARAALRHRAARPAYFGSRRAGVAGGRHRRGRRPRHQSEPPRPRRRTAVRVDVSEAPLLARSPVRRNPRCRSCRS